ncbi:MAG: lipopolysaccharide transport periplasmic protein LptA [bacterium]
MKKNNWLKRDLNVKKNLTEPQNTQRKKNISLCILWLCGILTWILISRGNLVWAGKKLEGLDEIKEISEAKEKIQINSDQVELNNKNHTAIYTGNVIIIKAEAKLYAKKMTTYLGEKNDAILRIEAEGNVRFEYQDKKISSDKAIYYNDLRKILLIGNPVLFQGDTNIRAEEIVYLMDEDRVIATGAIMEFVPQNGNVDHLKDLKTK